MKLLILNGPSCVGKSTIVREILKRRENTFYLSSDNLKRNFSQYSFEKDSEKVFELVCSVAQFVFNKKYDTICDSSLWKARREKVISLAKDASYEIVEVNLEADEEVLRKRFEERVERSAHPSVIVKPANTSVVRWKELFDMYHEEKNMGAVTFRTDELSEEEVVTKVMGLF